MLETLAVAKMSNAAAADYIATSISIYIIVRKVSAIFLRSVEVFYQPQRCGQYLSSAIRSVEFKYSHVIRLPQIKFDGRSALTSFAFSYVLLIVHLLIQGFAEKEVDRLCALLISL